MKKDFKFSFWNINCIISLFFTVICAIMRNSIFSLIYFICLFILLGYYVKMKKKDEIICLSIQIVPCIGILTYNGMAFHNILLVLSLFGMFIIKKKINIPKNVMIFYLITVLLDFIKYISNLNNYNVSLDGFLSVFILYFCIFYGIVIFYEIKNTIRNKCEVFIKHFIFGTFCSILYGIVFRTLKYGIKYAIMSPNAGYRNYGASVDPNYFGFYITLSICFILILYLNNKKRIFSSLIAMLCFFIAGFSSISRMFLILCVPIILYLLIIWLKTFVSKKIIQAVCVLVSVVGLLFVFKPFIMNNLELIMGRLNVDSSQDISNGRMDLSTGYIDLVNNNMKYMFIGAGVSKYYKRLDMPLYTHNFYVELYVCFGLIGVLIFLYLFIKFILTNKLYKNGIYLLPLIMVLIAGLAISFVDVEIIYIIISLVIGYIKVLNKKNDNGVENEESITYIE